MHIPALTLQRWVFATALVVSVGLFPQQGQAAPPKSDSATPIKSDQATPTKPAQTTASKQGATAPKLSLGEDSTIRIPVGSADGEVQVMIKAENLADADVAEANNLVLKDLGGAGSLPSTKVEFRNPVAIDSGTTTRAWLMIARISKLPANSSQKRSARFSFGKVEQYIDYTVTNLSPAAFTWSVAAPGVPWLVWFGYPDTRRTMTVVVTTGDYPASNLRLAQANLRGGSGTSQIALEDLELCESAIGPCGHFNINARTSRTFYVRLKEKEGQSFWQNGDFNGSLSFAVNERPELQTINVTLQASSSCAKLTGTGLLFIGILVAWVTGEWGRARLLRLEALRPVAVLRKSVEALVDEIKHAPEIADVELKDTKAALMNIETSLKEEELDSLNLLPPKVPDPRNSVADTTPKLKDHLDKNSQLVDCLTVVICDGMRTLWSAWNETLSLDIKEKIKKALRELNLVGGEVRPNGIINRAAVEPKVKAILEAYRTSRGLMADPTRKEIKEPTVLQVNWQIARLFELQWLVWGILTFLVGVAMLIVTKPGFGAPLDFLFCLLWGFGLPTGIDRLQKLGPGDIATTIGIHSPTKKTP